MGISRVITQKRLKALLDYNSETGMFFWKVSNSGNRRGTLAGTLDSYGYRQIKIDGNEYLAQQLAWLHTHGYLPDRDIKHINNIKDDNRIENLR